MKSAVCDAERRERRDGSFSGTDVAVYEAIHGDSFGKVETNFFDGFPLCVGEREGEYRGALIDEVRICRKGKGGGLLPKGFDAKAFELREEHVVEGKSLSGDFDFIERCRKMQHAEGARERWEVKLLDERGWKRIRDTDFLFEERFDLPANEFGGESVGFRIDGDEARGVRRSPIGALKGGREHDQAIAVARYLARNANAHVGCQCICDELLVKPDQAKCPRIVGDIRFEYRHAPFPRLFFSERGEHSFKGGFFSFERRGDLFYFREIFVARGNVKEKVANRVNAERGTFREECLLDGWKSINGGVSGDHSSNRAFFRSIVKSLAGVSEVTEEDCFVLSRPLTRMFLSVFVNERNSDILKMLSAKGALYSFFVCMNDSVVKDIMTVSVISVEPHEALQKVASLLTEHRIHGVPVLDGGKIVGIITETDFFTKDSSNIYLPSYIDFMRKMRVASEMNGSRREMVDRLMQAKAKDIMSVPCQTVAESLPVKDLIKKFKETGLSVFPVVNEQEALVGIVAIADVLKSFDSSAV